MNSVCAIRIFLLVVFTSLHLQRKYVLTLLSSAWLLFRKLEQLEIAAEKMLEVL